MVFGVVAVVGFVGFAAGVGVSERAGVPEAGLLAQLYYALGLFLFGGLDLGTPIGGPAWARVLLWAAYFAAPLVTASAVVEAVMRLVQPEALRIGRAGGHVVVAGCGRLAELYLERLRAHDARVRVVVVVDPAREADADALRETFGVHTYVGDVTALPVLARLGLPRARRVVLLTEDDFTNLDAAAKILEHDRTLGERLIVHVSDLAFMRTMAPTALAHACRVFNGHEIAATHLVQTQILDHFRRTEPADTVVLAGFGRFGQTVLAQLQARAAGAFARVVIVDLEASREAGVFARQVGFTGGYDREVLDGDMLDPQVWARIEATVEAGSVEPVIVVGSGVDRANLRVAMAFGRRFDDALVLARSERRWAFADAFSAEAGVHTLSVAELVARSMPEAWFGGGDAVATTDEAGALPKPELRTGEA